MSGTEESKVDLDRPVFHEGMYPKGVNADFYNIAKLDREKLVEKFVGRFEDPENRDIAKSAPAFVSLLEQYGLHEGATIVDLGAGTGLFLPLLSKSVGQKGKVIGVEVSQDFAAHLEDKIKAEGLANVEIILSADPCSPGLEEYKGSVDIVVIIDVYHHLERPVSVCSAIHKALKDAGRLVVLDFIRDERIHKSHPPPWIMEHVRAGQEVFRSEIVSAGFSLESEPILSGLDENYIMVFKKAAAL
jgi:cyclopropane fatty-acyl-phospholipid synthase-like methyltransferase